MDTVREVLRTTGSTPGRESTWRSSPKLTDEPVTDELGMVYMVVSAHVLSLTAVTVTEEDAELALLMAR